MGDEQGGDADLGLNPTDLVAQLRAHLGVERRERLVEQQDLRLDRERPGQRHALLLPAGELMRIAAALVRQMHELEQPVRHALALSLAIRRRRRPKATLSRAVRCGTEL